MKQTILITGGTGNIGQVLVKKFLQINWKVIVISRSSDKLKKLQHSLNSKNIKNLYTYIYNLEKNVDRLESLIDKLKQDKLNVQVLINAARNLNHLKVNKNIPSANWINEFNLAVTIPYQLTMLLARQGNLNNVINIASIYGVVAINPNLYLKSEHIPPPNYGVAKAAMIQLTKELAVRLAGQNIRVNCISFGGVEGRVDKSFQERYQKLCPQRRMLTKNDLFNPVKFLATQKSSGITGHNLIVDGGWTTW